jgi:hypothetical protein
MDQRTTRLSPATWKRLGGHLLPAARRGDAGTSAGCWGESAQHRAVVDERIGGRFVYKRWRRHQRYGGDSHAWWCRPCETAWVA